ncbi:MAG: hypothetical protein AMJ41_02235 [candidate division Zixibacteria bacterium DG_27]|nr:MAG: hypothetical protein AMJ41_02235 [candidate division Zixibacteria bacterium DG_27]
MNSKSKRVGKQNLRERSYWELSQEILKADTSSLERRVERLRRTFHCSFTKASGSKERCLMI